VKVEIVVGSDGIIRKWTCGYEWDGAVRIGPPLPSARTLK